MKIAIDIGGVIFQGTNPDGDADAVDELVPGVLEAIEALAAKHELWILSFCGLTTEARTRTALALYGIDHWIPRERWLYVRKPTLKGSAMLEHDIDLLIDDRKDNVQRVRDAGLQAILFTSWDTLTV
jgi:hypothetical protein